jgi:S1-C subfamily serine protease
MKKSLSLSVAVVVVAAALLACSFSGLAPTVLPASSPTTVAVVAVPATGSSQPVANLVNEQDRLVAIYQQAGPGVVLIKTSTAFGSGWVYNSDGIIVTNEHVISGETSVEVDFPSGEKVFGNVAASDTYSDLAIIKVDPTAVKLVPLPLGDSSALQVGQIVVAIGNPWVMNNTMTTGIVSALGRTVQSGSQSSSGGSFSTGDIIQTDAALNPGNSGGPLLDLNGNVIGVNSQIRTDNYTTSGEPINSGVGFAISVNTVKRVIPSLISKGKVDYPYLGIGGYVGVISPDMPLDLINALGLKNTYGAYVLSVVPGGPSDKAGIHAGTTPLTLQGATNIYSGGDLIIAADGHKITNFDDLISYLAVYKSPGDTVHLTVLRGSQQLDIPVVLGTRP